MVKDWKPCEEQKMRKEHTEKLIVKRTFEDTLTSQEQLRNSLEMLIQENRCLTSDERNVFSRQLAFATFGLGREIDYTIIVSNYIGRETLGSVEYSARLIMMLDENYMMFKRITDNTNTMKEIKVPISKLWKALLYGLFDVFPLALDRASAMSKEVDATGSDSGYEFAPDE